MSDTGTLTAARVPTVYFIDDSATMREVIKIAFRKENIHVVTCPDAATAMAQFGEMAPDAVITDVIMPDKDGYEVCQYIKQHEQLGRTPVILMSGVVNRTVAEKAMAVKADELIRKPFQPQDLIARVKNLLNPKIAGSSASDNSAGDSAGRLARFLASIVRSIFSKPCAGGSSCERRCSTRGQRSGNGGSTKAKRTRARCSAPCAGCLRAGSGFRFSAHIRRNAKAAQRNPAARTFRQEAPGRNRSRTQILRSSRGTFQDASGIRVGHPIPDVTAPI